MLQSGQYARVEYLIESHPYQASAFFGSVSGDSAYQADFEDINSIGKVVIAAQTLLALATFGALRTDAGRELPLPLQLLPWAALACLLLSSEPVAGWLAQAPRLGMVQFAWRWQLLIALWCAIGLASLKKGPPGYVAWGLGAAVLVFFSPLLTASKRAPAQAEGLPPSIALSELDERGAVVRAAYSANALELRPRDADWLLHLRAPYGRIEVVDKEIGMQIESLAPSTRMYRLKSTGGGRLRLVTYDCPGWSARLDGQDWPIATEPGTGLQLVDVPSGEHVLELGFEPVGWF